MFPRPATNGPRSSITPPSTIRPTAAAGPAWIGFLVGGLLVVLVIIAIVVFSSGGLNRASDTNVDLDVDLPEAPSLPAPELPDLPPVEPPSVPDPTPAPAN
ncbi:MAG: hypothetical protein KL785_02090 [Brevundimonas sp.]|nr:hypothetical protein [Brevundimonas sp.]